MKKRNYESDFVAVMSMPAELVDVDFIIEFTTVGRNVYTVSRRGDVYVNCKAVSDGEIAIIFKDHKLIPGVLKMKLTTWTNASGEILKSVLPKIEDIELVAGAGDEITDAEIELLMPYAVIDAYDMAVKAGYKGTREEYIKMISSKPKFSSEGMVLHRKCIRYNSNPGAVYSYPAMRFILTPGVNRFDVSKFVDSIFLNDDGQPIFKAGDTSHLLIYLYDFENVGLGYLSASIEAGVLIIDNSGGYDAGLLRLKNGYNFFNEDRSLSIADLKTITCSKLAFPFDLSTINRNFLKLKFEPLQRFSNESFCLTGVVYDFFGTEIKLDYEVRKKVSFNKRGISRPKKAIRRKRWVRRSITNHPPLMPSPMGIIIGRSLRVSTGEDSLFSFDLRIRLANHRHTSVSDWVYLNVRLSVTNETGVYSYIIMWA